MARFNYPKMGLVVTTPECVHDVKPERKRPGKRPKLHKGTRRSCPTCNPATYMKWRKHEARLKSIRVARGRKD